MSWGVLNTKEHTSEWKHLVCIYICENIYSQISNLTVLLIILQWLIWYQELSKTKLTVALTSAFHIQASLKCVKIQCLSLAHFCLSVKIKLITFHKSILSIYNSCVIIMSKHFTIFLHLKKDLIYQLANLRHSCPQRTAVLAVQVSWEIWKSLAASLHWSSWVDSPGPITHPGDSLGSISCFHCTAHKLQLTLSVHDVHQGMK